jgi:SAM-dependent methyltransferase
MPDVVFDERIAALFDTPSEMTDPAVLGPTVDFLAGLADGGRALEFGIGTGRVAIPLRARGVNVTGIDVSAPMIARLRSKPGAEDIHAIVGTCATTKADGKFSLVYCVWNSFMNLLTQDEQVQCFRNAAHHLAPGRSFVIEVLVPGLQRLPPGETVRPFSVTPTYLGFDEYDVVTQRQTSHHYWVVDGRLELWSSPGRYVWPSELDLMGELAGLSLRERWGGWDRSPFGLQSENHVSVWTKPEVRS